MRKTIFISVIFLVLSSCYKEKQRVASQLSTMYNANVKINTFDYNSNDTIDYERVIIRDCDFLQLGLEHRHLALNTAMFLKDELIIDDSKEIEVNIELTEGEALSYKYSSSKFSIFLNDYLKNRELASSFISSLYEKNISKSASFF